MKNYTSKQLETILQHNIATGKSELYFDYRHAARLIIEFGLLNKNVSAGIQVGIDGLWDKTKDFLMFYNKTFSQPTQNRLKSNIGIPYLLIIYPDGRGNLFYPCFCEKDQTITYEEFITLVNKKVLSQAERMFRELEEVQERYKNLITQTDHNNIWFKDESSLERKSTWIYEPLNHTHY